MGSPRKFCRYKIALGCPVFGLGTTTMNLHTRSLLLLAIAVAQTYGAIYDKVSQLPTHAYDYIIVGGALPTQYPEPEGYSSAIVVRRYCW